MYEHHDCLICILLTASLHAQGVGDRSLTSTCVMCKNASNVARFLPSLILATWDLRPVVEFVCIQNLKLILGVLLRTLGHVRVVESAGLVSHALDMDV